MYVFEAGAGCSGTPRLVQPGDELNLTGEITSETKFSQDCVTNNMPDNSLLGDVTASPCNSLAIKLELSMTKR